jgi:antitoxin HicB
MECKGYNYTVLFEPSEEGGYVVTCPALPGLVTEGDTLEEAREMARDAIRAYLESLVKDGRPIPGNKELALDPAKEHIRVACCRGMSQRLPALRPKEVLRALKRPAFSFTTKPAATAF